MLHGNAVFPEKVSILRHFVSAQIEMVPQNYTKVTGEDNLKLMDKLLDSMEDDDDVQNVWHNWDRD